MHKNKTKNELLFKVLSLVPGTTMQPLRPTLERKGERVMAVGVDSCQMLLIGVELYGRTGMCSS